MKSRTMAIFCAVLSLMFFAVPLSALASGSGDPIDTKIGPYSLSRVYESLEGMDTGSLYLNGIPYRPSSNAQGEPILYSGDLAAALDGAELLQNNSGIFKADDLLVSGGKLGLNEGLEKEAAEIMSQMEKGNSAISGATFTGDQVSKYGPEMAEALDELGKLIDALEPEEAREGLRTLFDNFKAKKSIGYFSDNPRNAAAKFRTGLRDVYRFLSDARAALARLSATKDVSAALEKIENSALMQTMKTVLKETLGEAEYPYTDFWTDDSAWAAYAKQALLDEKLETQRKLSSLIGETLVITDAQGNQLQIEVTGIAPKSTPKPSSHRKSNDGSIQTAVPLP